MQERDGAVRELRAMRLVLLLRQRCRLPPQTFDCEFAKLAYPVGAARSGVMANALDATSAALRPRRATMAHLLKALRHGPMAHQESH